MPSCRGKFYSSASPLRNGSVRKCAEAVCASVRKEYARACGCLIAGVDGKSEPWFRLRREGGASIKTNAFLTCNGHDRLMPIRSLC